MIDRTRLAFVGLIALTAALSWTCADADRDARICDPGTFKCDGTVALKCFEDGTGYQLDTDCANDGFICAPSLGCKTCIPNSLECFGEKLLRCNESGSGYQSKAELTCDADAGEICYQGSCENACQVCTTLARFHASTASARTSAIRSMPMRSRARLVCRRRSSRRSCWLSSAA